MFVAVIDMGTNTFNLSIGNWEMDNLKIIFSTKEGVALGKGGINKGVITSEATERAISCLLKFKEICIAHNVKQIRAIGTSAIRGAKNKMSFCSEVMSKTGIVIEVISGEREAELIYKGIAITNNFESRSVVMDIGGGSTEFILVQNASPKKFLSFDIGISRIIQQFNFSDPLCAQDINDIEIFLSTHCSDDFLEMKADVLVGASGSFETFYELVHQRKFPEGLQTHTIDVDDFIVALHQIIASTQEEREVNEFIIPIRKIMAPIAAVKTRWVLKMLGAKTIIISPCSLKEGVFSELQKQG